MSKKVEIDPNKREYFETFLKGQIADVELESIIDNIFRAWLDQVSSQAQVSYSQFLESKVEKREDQEE